MKSTELNNDLDFLSNYWKHVNDISATILTELPKMDTKVQMIGKNIGIIHFKDLGDTWSVKGLFGRSTNLDALARKISTMIDKGDAQNVQPMLRRIVQKGVVALSRPASTPQGEGEFYGYGHFRWDYQAWVLNKNELERLKTYFNL